MEEVKMNKIAAFFKASRIKIEDLRKVQPVHPITRNPVPIKTVPKKPTLPSVDKDGKTFKEHIYPKIVPDKK
jgi:hypothetical protein